MENFVILDCSMNKIFIKLVAIRLFFGVVRGYLMLPPKSRLSLDNTSPDDRNFLSSVYMKSNDNGATLCMTKSYAKNKLLKKIKKRSWTNKGDARIKNKQRI